MMNTVCDTCLISVVIPAYNAESTLARAIQSVFDDRHPSKEILVVDDGSTDGTRDVARQFLDNNKVRVRLIGLAHSGANKARNVGLRLSEGKFVQFLDADDCLINNKLSRSVEIFEADADINLVYTGTKSINSSALASNKFSYFTHGINTVAAVWRRDYLIKSGLEWNEALQCWQEAEFYFRALLQIGGAHRIHNLPGDFILRERTSTGISSRYFSEPYIFSQNMAIDCIYDQCKKQPKGTATVEGQYSHYKKSLLMRSAICGAANAWRLLALEVRKLPVSIKWKIISYTPYWVVRGAYKMYRRVKYIRG